ncbi:hypothetical protein [Nocardia iowensis]|uniref:Uncharacterized protein n=1 Tax=Nocardia iowensis TaxID=204891 RepID=A0ABX8RK67_NOCIO|nr:hypothetical protein [Nocardia iowensis]QXN88815.1 hypothetical protein KV110_24895 [Nocardia iowensis]
MDKPSRQSLERLWGEHRQAPFPPRARGVDIAGVDLVMLDGATAGCVHTALSHALDDRRRRALVKCIESLGRILPHLEDEYEAEYFERVRDIAVVLAALEGVEIDAKPSP